MHIKRHLDYIRGKNKAVLTWFPWSIFMLCCSFSLIFSKIQAFWVKICFVFTHLNICISSASSFEFSAVILQVGPSYLASGAQACLCLFIELPLKASSSLLVCGSACASSFIPFLSPQHPPPPKHTHIHYPPPQTSGTRKEESDRRVVTWNLGRSCRVLRRRRRKTPWGVKAVRSRKEKSSTWEKPASRLTH